MHFLYNLSLRLLFSGIWLAQFFNPKAKKWIAGRKGILGNLPEIPQGKKVYWFHCASLGEFDQGLPLMKKIKEQDDSVFLLVTFFSPSGFENYHKRKQQLDFVTYLPLDTPSNAQHFLDHFKPVAVFFVKYEFWSNYIFEAKKAGTKIYSVCTIFRPEHRFFSWYGAFFRKTLRQFDHFFVQNQHSLKLLESIGIKEATLVGDMRFDRVLEHREQVQKDETVSAFLKGEKAFIVGSSWSVDEQFLKETILNYSKTGKVIIAPHDIKESHLQEIEQLFKGQTVRYSAFRDGQIYPSIMLVDSIGKLANLYQYGKFAYIGGGFSGSLHNILEPAVFGLAVIFGPKHERFPEAQLFIDEGVGFSLSDKAELEKTISKLTSHEEELISKLHALVQVQAGASEKILRELKLGV